MSSPEDHLDLQQVPIEGTGGGSGLTSTATTRTRTPPNVPNNVPYPNAELEMGGREEGFHDVDMNSSGINDEFAQNNNASFHGRRERELDRHHNHRDEPPPPLTAADTSTTATSSNSAFLTRADVSSIQRLDADYEKALLRREIGWNARYISVRQNAGLSLWTFFLIIMCGTIFFELNTNWTLSESLLFSVYTITTVGYGNHPIPKKSKVLLFISLYIFVGIAMLTIMAAQLYQWLVLELTWRQYERDSNQILKRHKQNIKTSEEMGATIGEMPVTVMQQENLEEAPKKSFCDKVFDTVIEILNKVQAYIKNNPSGQLIVVMIPFSLLILLGALVVGSIERWDAIESLYFAVVSMTTVGFGDYFPEKFASTWFCIIWLPFSVGFLSLYLGSIANLYIDISEKNVKRIERKLHRQVNLARSEQNREREEAIARGTSAGFDLDIDSGGNIDDMNSSLDVSHLHQPRRQDRRDAQARGFATLVADDSIEMEEEDLANILPDHRRQNIIANSGLQRFDSDDAENEEAMKTMRNVIAAVKLNMTTPRRSQGSVGGSAGGSGTPGPSSPVSDILNVKSTRHYNTSRGVEKKPTFALRVLLQERFCHIIAREIAGYQSSSEIKNNTLSVTIDSLKYTADKWQIPRRARKSFRTVAFEVLYFCGERDLIVRGAEAVFDLRPHEVQGLFAPLLAAFGDADTMEAWLMRTQTMAENELHDDNIEESSEEKLRLIEQRRAEKITQNLTATPNVKRNVIGNAVTNQSS